MNSTFCPDYCKSLADCVLCLTVFNANSMAELCDRVAHVRYRVRTARYNPLHVRSLR